MTDSESKDELIDRVVDMVMRGQDPDVEGLIAGTPDIAPATRDELRKVAVAFARGKIASSIVLPRDSALPFEELGPYKLLSRMGEGGMGMVYLAEHGFLKRRVALKIIRPELAFSEVTRRRFQREAMSIAKLRHENIVSVYDAGEHNGVAYLAMELVEGQGLDELLQAARSAGERMNVISAVRHARGIALALQCAHEAGIIHRDVKPSNVRITPDGRELLLDFGLSLAEEMTSISSSGQFRGTPQYASPEQIEMDSADIDARTDVYSLGITLYECLTGQVPFDGTSMRQLFQQILVREPPEPRKLNARVDEALNGIVMRAIAKRRENRFSSAGEMANALGEWLSGAERAATTRPRKMSRAAGIIAAVGLIGLTTTLWFVLHTSEVASIAAPQPLVHVAPRNTTALLGAPGLAFDQRLNTWDPLIGQGTFGSEDEGPGVGGFCTAGMIARPHVLPGGNGNVSGRIEVMPPKPGERTLGAGAGIEFSNGRIVALLLDSAADGYEVHAYELLRDGGSGMLRGAQLESATVTWSAGKPLKFRLSWNGTDTQFEWGDVGATAYSGSMLIPHRLRKDAQPSRFLLIVDKGRARFENLVLEES